MMKVLLAGLAVGSLLLFGCDKDEGKKGKSFGAPLIKPPVDEATPEAFKPSAALHMQQVAAEIFNMTPAQRVQKALTEKKGAINGGDCNGHIGCALQAMDARIDEVNKRSAETEKKCQSQAPVDFVFAPFSSASITINAQCNDIFANDAMTQGESGLIFGKQGSIFSIGMTLNQTDGRFGYAATYDETSSDVRYVEASYNKTGNTSRETLVNLKANRASKSFELYYASSGGDAIGCGTHLISDGSNIFITGKFQGSFEETCDNTEQTSFCIDAKTMAEILSGCSLSAANFTIEETPFSEVSGSSEVLKEKIGASKYASYGIPFIEDAETD